MEQIDDAMDSRWRWHPATESIEPTFSTVEDMPASTFDQDSVLDALSEIYACVQKHRHLFNGKVTASRCRLPLAYNPSQSRLDTESVKLNAVLKSRLDSLAPITNTLNDISSWYSRQRSDCDYQIDSLSLRAGLEKLPDDVLLLVLQLAADHSDEHRQMGPGRFSSTVDWKWKGVKSAVGLSHVCRRFRTQILSSPTFWNFITNVMPTELISSCASRSKGFAAFLFLKSKPKHDIGLLKKSNGTPSIDSVMTAMVSNSVLCKKFELDFTTVTYESVSPDAEALEQFAPLMRTLEFPSITEIAISYPRKFCELYANGPDAVKALHFYHAWSFPNIRSMSGFNFTPILFSGMASLKTLELNLHPNPPYIHRNFRDRPTPVRGDRYFDIAALTDFLSACPVLETFALRIIGDPPTYSAPESRAPIDCASIHRVSFHLSECPSTVISSLLRTVRFPSVSVMSLVVVEDTSLRTDRRAEDIIRTLFSRETFFGNLKELTLEVKSETKGPTNEFIHIPLSRFSKLHYLSLKLHRSAPEPVPGDSSFPPLRNIRLTECPGISPEWVSGVLQQHKTAFPDAKLEMEMDSEFERRWLKFLQVQDQPRIQE